MMTRIKLLFLQLVESYLFIAILAILAGLLWDNQLIKLTAYATIMLQVIFFLSSIKIELNDVKKALKDFYPLLLVNVFMLVLLPIVVYLVTSVIIPEMSIALMILAAMPAGMTVPLLTEVIKGDVNYALVLTVTTSLLAPITIPLMIKLLAGTSVVLSFTDMFLKLVYVIFIPFILAQLVKYYFHPRIKKSYFTFKPISLALLGLLIAALVAKNAEAITSDLGMLVKYLVILFIFFVVIHIVGYFLVFWKTRKERLTVAVGVTYMNFTLAIYLGLLYFNEPSIILPLVMAIIPWAILLIPFKKTLVMLKLK